MAIKHGDHKQFQLCFKKEREGCNINMNYKQRLLLFLLFFNCYLVSHCAFSETKVVNLVVGYKTVNFAGKNIQAIAVNNQIPAPTLHFKEGDHVVINVFNHLNEGTIIHWHGIILPWQMDGVEGISQPAIAPQKMFRYHFTIRQSGTYWYHAHAGFQEQQGLYGAFIIDPKIPSKFYDTKDFVMVLSDWSNTNPNQIFSNLKKDGDYYSPRFPLQASLFKFIHDYRQSNSAQKKLLLDDYNMMQHMRMGIYDLSDVAYDAFLLNGKPNAHPWTGLVKVGDIVRLRFIDAAASTNFHIKIPGHILQIIQVDGNDVRPIDVKHFFITPGETYDVLVKITHKTPTIIDAESSDTIGAAMGALITHSNQTVNYKNVKLFHEPIPVTQEMMKNMNHLQQIKNMGDMKMSDHSMSSHKMNMTMQIEPSIGGDHAEKLSSLISTIKTNGTKYQDFISIHQTNNPKKSIAGVIRMELFGYMGQYIWMINGLPEYKAKPIIFKSNDILKIYKVVPDKIWVNDDEKDENGKYVKDIKVEVPTEELKKLI